MNKTVIITSSAIVAAVLAVVAFMTLGGDSPEPAAQAPTAAASAEASPSPSPTVQMVEGVFPIPVLPSESIPWNEIGPGWFLLEWDEDSEDNPEWDREDWLPWYEMTREQVETEELEYDYHYDILLLNHQLLAISPEGALYEVLMIDNYGPAGEVESWNGGAATLTSGNPVWEHGGISRVLKHTLDLRTGEITFDRGPVPDVGPAWRVAGGHEVVYLGDEGVEWVDVAGPGGKDNICYGGNLSVAVSPDNKSLICLEGGPGEGSTAVVFVDLEAATVNRSQIDTFRHSAEVYSIPGWLDNDVFILRRWNEEGPNSYFTYNVSTRKIADFTLPMNDGSPAPAITSMGGYLLVGSNVWGGLGSESGANSSGVEAVVNGGSQNVVLPCAPKSISGASALTLCVAEGSGAATLAVTNLVTGETHVMGTVPEPEDGWNDYNLTFNAFAVEE